MMEARRQVELLEKNRPRQERAKRTYEAILNAAAELLIEVGIERISTNLIAERAGITVPALYRYFPNKYAVINALGAKLMDRQNLAVFEWMGRRLEPGRPDALTANIHEVLEAIYQITHEQVGGAEIAQALRAVAPLQEVRLASHRLVSEHFAEFLSLMFKRPVDEQLRLDARMTVELGYGVVELALEESEFAPHLMLRRGATVLEHYWRNSAWMKIA
jgi:AcrR family transcriptional regulator